MTHNANEVLRSSRQLHRNLQGITVKAVDAGTEELQAAIRSNIPRSRGQSAGRFAGYAASGALWSDVQKTAARRAGTVVTADVYMRPGRSRLYQRIHEHGGIIRARRKPYLVFKIGGRWVRVKQVRIRKKEYFSGATMQRARPRIEAAMARVLSRFR